MERPLQEDGIVLAQGHREHSVTGNVQVATWRMLHASAIAPDLCAPVLFMSPCENDAVVMVDATRAMEMPRWRGWAIHQRVFVPDD
jgi:hypothetical protein